ncbi:MAG: glycosyltransferase family 39 protein, partial [Anaerolineae bacterium]|nr:glycosyltransferase family 39 protein [Anaerolineae bacterium]
MMRQTFERESREGRLRGEWLTAGLVLLFGLVVIAPLLQPGYFWGAHDARHDVYFIQQYGLSFREGILWPRWSPDWTFGYGYPFFTVYAPLSTFVGVLFNQVLGLGYEASVKAVLALSIIGSGFAMYGFVRSWLGRWAGLVAAVAYMAVPYHLVNVFVRAAMAESFALALLPLALWGFRAAVVRPRVAAVIGAGVAFAAIMWTSNLVALVFAPALAAYVLALIFFEARERRRQSDRPTGLLRDRALLLSFVAPALAMALGLGLSAAFFIPALLEQGYINRTQWFGDYYDPTQHFVFLNQLFDPRWGFGISQPGPNDAAQGSLSYQLGAAATLLSLVALAISGQFRPRVRGELRFWGLWLLVAIFLMLPVSAWAWHYVPIVGYAQFPWRYLMLAILPLSILPAALVA